MAEPLPHPMADAGVHLGVDVLNFPGLCADGLFKSNCCWLALLPGDRWDNHTPHVQQLRAVGYSDCGARVQQTACVRDLPCLRVPG